MKSELVRRSSPSALTRFRRNTVGANLVEYLMLAGLIAIFCIAVVKIFGTNVKEKINKQASAIQSQINDPTP